MAGNERNGKYKNIRTNDSNKKETFFNQGKTNCFHFIASQKGTSKVKKTRSITHFLGTIEKSEGTRNPITGDKIGKLHLKSFLSALTV